MCTWSFPKSLLISEVVNKLQRIEIADHQSTGRNVHGTFEEMVCKEEKLGKQRCGNLFVDTNSRETGLMCDDNHLLLCLTNFGSWTWRYDIFVSARNCLILRAAGLQVPKPKKQT